MKRTSRSNHLDHRVAVASLLLLAVSGAAQGRPPAWHHTNMQFRAVCELPDRVRDAFLVRLPVPDGVPSVNSVAAVDGDGRELAVRVVKDGPDAWIVTVGSTDGAPFARPRTAIVYYGHDPSVSAIADDGPVTDLPVRGVLRPIAGQGAPPTWERYHYMFFQPGGARHAFHAPSIAPFDFGAVLERDIADDAREAFRERHRNVYRNHHFIGFESWIRLPDEAPIRFALRGGGLGVVFVEGVEVVTVPAGSAAADWMVGEPINLDVQVARIEVYVTGRQQSPAELGWVRPGRTDPESLPDAAWLAPVEVEPRLERIDHPLHPDFAITPARGRPFAFRGHDTVFVPVTFENRTQSWTGHPVTAFWRDGAGTRIGTGDRLEWMLMGAERHTIELEVRDRLGFSGVARRTFDARRIEPQWFAVDVKLLDVPAVSYAEDVVMPALHLTGQTPPGYPARAVWRVRTADGDIEGVRDVPLSGNQTEVVPLGRFKAGAMHDMDWTIEVAGVVLQSESVRFLRPPFDVLPARADGDALLGPDGRRIALVPHRYAGEYRQSTITEAQAFGHLICVDETLTRHSRRTHPGAQSPFERVLARIVDGPDHPKVTVVALDEALPSHEAYAPLKDLVIVPALVRDKRADVAILSLGLNEILRKGDPDRFERLAAALSDLVSGTLGCPVVWVTPPPYGPRPERVRPYAVAVQRVADARGMPVADLYSGLLALGSGTPAFAESFDLDLTPEAEIHAARIVARAMLASDVPRPINLRLRFPW